MAWETISPPAQVDAALSGVSAKMSLYGRPPKSPYVRLTVYADVARKLGWKRDAFVLLETTPGLPKACRLSLNRTPASWRLRGRGKAEHVYITVRADLLGLEGRGLGPAPISYRIDQDDNLIVTFVDAGVVA